MFASASVRAAEAEAVSVCDVLTHPREYLGQTVTFTGTFFHGVHATYFRPEGKCADALSIQAVGAIPPPKHGLTSALATAEGTIVVHHQLPERMIGKPAEVVAFSVARFAVQAGSGKQP